MTVNDTNLKYGFQWLRKQNTSDAVVVDENTHASVLEHLVFRYDLFAEYLSLCADITDYGTCKFLATTQLIYLQAVGALTA